MNKGKLLSSILLGVSVLAGCNLPKFDLANVDELPAYNENCSDIAVSQHDLDFVNLSMVPALTVSDIVWNWVREDFMKPSTATRSAGAKAYFEFEVLNELIEDGLGGTIKFNRFYIGADAGAVIASLRDLKNISVEDLDASVSFEIYCDVEFDGFTVHPEFYKSVNKNMGYSVVSLNKGYLKGSLSLSLDLRDFFFNTDELKILLQEKAEGVHGEITAYGDLVKSKDLNAFLRTLITRTLSGKAAAGWHAAFYTGCTMEWNENGILYGTKMENSFEIKKWKLPFAIDIIPLVEGALSDEGAPVYQSKKDLLESIMDGVIADQLYMNPVGDWLSVNIGYFDRQNKPIYEKEYVNSELIVDLIYAEK